METFEKKRDVIFLRLRVEATIGVDDGKLWKGLPLVRGCWRTGPHARKALSEKTVQMVCFPSETKVFLFACVNVFQVLRR